MHDVCTVELSGSQLKCSQGPEAALTENSISQFNKVSLAMCCHGEWLGEEGISHTAASSVVLSLRNL